MEACTPMKLGGRKAGSLTMFIDSASNETVLKIQIDPQGRPLVAYRLYDCRGHLVADCSELREYPDGLRVVSHDEEILLDISPDLQDHICYHLYNSQGKLLTLSTGMRTQVFPTLRMDGKSTVSGRAKDPV